VSVTSESSGKGIVTPFHFLLPFDLLGEGLFTDPLPKTKNTKTFET